MLPEEKYKFIDLMKELSLNFKGFHTNNKQDDLKKVDLYFEELKRYTLKAVKRGIKYIISTRIYPDFPMVGHIVQAIKDSKHRTLE